jgi:hypothetical protein
MSWAIPAPKWDTVAGRILDGFLKTVHESLPDHRQPMTVIGSAVIQLCLDEAFTSADVDVMVLSDAERLRGVADRSGFGGTGTRSNQPAYGVQICPPRFFKPPPHYLQRAHTELRHGIPVVVPHVRDVLIAKLHRFRSESQEGLVLKDSRAFDRVRALCGGRPSVEDLIEDLVQCEAEFRVPVDGSVNAFRLNVLDLFATHYGKKLDIEREIVQPLKLAEDQVRYFTNEVTRMISELEPERP